MALLSTDNSGKLHHRLLYLGFFILLNKVIKVSEIPRYIPVISKVNVIKQINRVNIDILY